MYDNIFHSAAAILTFFAFTTLNIFHFTNFVGDFTSINKIVESVIILAIMLVTLSVIQRDKFYDVLK